MRRVIFSSPGKIILSGEHSVVYGHDAIATSINLRCFCGMQKIKSNAIQIFNNNQYSFIPNDLLSISEDNWVKFCRNQKIIQLSFLQKCFLFKINLFLTKYRQQNILKYFEHNSLKIQTYSEIIQGGGLGSSAALSVSFSACLYQLFHQQLLLLPSKQNICQLSFQYEKIYHQNPSGIDNTICCFGKTLFFNKNGFLKELQKDLKLNIKIINTHKIHNTKEAIKKVREYIQKNGNQVIKTIGLITQQLESLLLSQQINIEALKTLIRENQKYLSILGLTNDEIDNIIQKENEKGYACKITGAGMGGSCISFGYKTGIFIGVQGIRQQRFFPKFQ